MSPARSGAAWTACDRRGAGCSVSLGISCASECPRKGCAQRFFRPPAEGPVSAGSPGTDLGLSMVDLSDGSYSTTTIYPVNGIPGNSNENKAAGNFYVQFTGDLCAYHI